MFVEGVGGGGGGRGIKLKNVMGKDNSKITSTACLMMQMNNI